MDRCTENYSCLVLDQTCPTNRLEDCIFWYKSTLDLPPFKMGKPIFHQLSAKHAKSERQRRQEAEVRMVASSPADRRVTEVSRTDRKGRVIKEDREGSVILE